MRCKMGWPHTSMWWLRTRRAIVAATVVPSREATDPNPIRASPAWSTGVGKRNPYDIWVCKTVGIQTIHVGQKAEGNPGILLNELCTDSLSGTHLRLQWTVTRGTSDAYRGAD